jgi:hypothetical protein
VAAGDAEGGDAVVGIHVNGDNNVVHNTVTTYNDDGRRELPSPPLGFFTFALLMIILVSLLIKFWYIALIVVSLSALAFANWMERQDRGRTKAAVAAEARLREAALALRAENQNSAYLRGESWGVYGNFPPPSVVTEAAPEQKEQ